MREIEAARGNAVPQGTDAAGEGPAGRQGVRAVARSRDGGRAVRMLWAAGGFAAFGLGALGAVLPIVPTTPFLLVAAFCFARSSERTRRWFRATKLYRAVLEGYVAKRSMTAKAKLMLLVPLTAVLALSFALMAAVPAGRVVVAVVWAAHLVYFGFVVKTDRSQAAPGGEAHAAVRSGRAASARARRADGEGA